MKNQINLQRSNIMEALKKRWLETLEELVELRANLSCKYNRIITSDLPVFGNETRAKLYADHITDIDKLIEMHILNGDVFSMI